MLGPAKGEMLRNSHQILGAVLLSGCNEFFKGISWGLAEKKTPCKSGIPIKLHEKARFCHVSMDFFRRKELLGGGFKYCLFSPYLGR